MVVNRPEQRGSKMANEKEKAIQVVRDALAYARRAGLTNDQAYQAATAAPDPSLKGGLDILSGGSIPSDTNSRPEPVMAGKGPQTTKK
jgi:hypothetical protein